MATNEREFFDAVNMKAPALIAAHHRLLAAFRAEHALEVRFDGGKNTEHDLYKVYAAGTRIWLAMVYENGEVWAEFRCAEAAGHNETAAIFRALTGNNRWSKKLSDNATCQVATIAAIAEGPRRLIAIAGAA